MLSRHYVVPLTHLRTQHVGLHEAPWRKTAVKSKAVSDLGGVNPPLVVRFVRGCTFLKHFGIQRLSPGVYQSKEPNFVDLVTVSSPIFGEVQPSRVLRKDRTGQPPWIPGCTVRVAGQVRSADAGRWPGDSSDWWMVSWLYHQTWSFFWGFDRVDFQDFSKFQWWTWWWTIEFGIPLFSGKPIYYCSKIAGCSLTFASLEVVHCNSWLWRAWHLAME